MITEFDNLSPHPASHRTRLAWADHTRQQRRHFLVATEEEQVAVDTFSAEYRIKGI